MRIVKVTSFVAVAAFASLLTVDAHAQAKASPLKMGYRSALEKGEPARTSVPRNWKDVRGQTAYRLGRTAGKVVTAGRTIVGTGGRAALTVGFASGIIALAAIDASAIAHAPEVMQKGLEHAQDVANSIVEAGKTLAPTLPTVGAAAGIAAASYVGAPTAKYMGKGIVRVWKKGGIAVDMGIGAFHFALSLAATQDPMWAAAVGYGAQSLSFAARVLTPGAEFNTSLPSPRN